MNRDVALLALAAQQHGAVSRAQARALGLDSDALAHRVLRGDWSVAARRVMRATAAPMTDLQRVLVAVLDAGDDAFASHDTAAALWGLPGFTFSVLHVTRPRPSALRRPDAVEHRPRLLVPDHLTERCGIRCTTLPRTMFDLAEAGLSEARLARLVSSVVGRSPATLPAFRQVLDDLARPGRGGIRKMRRILGTHVDGQVPPTGLERRFEQLVDLAGEPPLRRQVDVGGHGWAGRVDYVDDEVLLIVEVDSSLHHTSPVDRAQDARRDQALLAAGYLEVLRIPEEWVWWQPDLVGSAVREARIRCRARLWARSDGLETVGSRPERQDR